MEMTLENKAKFFAQYYLSRVLMNDKFGISFVLNSTTLGDHHEGDHLLLKDLKSITEVEAVEIAEMHYQNSIDTQFFKGMYANNIKKYVLTSQDFISSRIADHLRSNGYAFPWMGLSVEQMVEEGWIKLI